MKQPSNKDSDLEDDDIASLFSAQNLSIPDDLKLSILEQAERLQTVEPLIGSNIVVADERFTANSKPHGDSNTGKHAQRHRSYSRSPWFAMAATVLIAVAVTPVLLNTPNSSLNSGGVTSLDLDTAAPVAENRPATAGESTAVAESAPFAESAVEARSAAIAEPAVLAESIDDANLHAAPESTLSLSATPATASMKADQRIDATSSTDRGTTLSGVQAMKQLASTAATGGAAGDSAISNSKPTPYRQTADQWIQEIQRLIDKKDYTLAQSEYRLFEKQHPDRARDFKPDFQSFSK